MNRRRVRMGVGLVAGAGALGVVVTFAALRAARPNEAVQLVKILGGPDAAEAAWAFVKLKEQPGGEVEAALEPLKTSQEPTAVTILWHVARQGNGHAMWRRGGYGLGDVARFILGARKGDRRDSGNGPPGPRWRLWPAEVVPPSRSVEIAKLLASQDSEARGLILLLCDGSEAEAWWAFTTLKSLDASQLEALLDAVDSSRPTAIRALASDGGSETTSSPMELGRVAHHLLWLRIDPRAMTTWTRHAGVSTRRAWQEYRARPGSR